MSAPSQAYALLIIGGGPAGLAAARAYRELAPTGRVAIVADEHRIPYRRPPLTKELLRHGTFSAAGDGHADTSIEPLEWFDAHRVELIGGRAVELNPADRTATLSGGRRLQYTTCLLATGAEPQRPPVPGADHPRVSVMRTLDDLHRLEESRRDGMSIAVIGSGFIACEIASSLAARGHPVELVSSDSAPNAARLGEAAAGEIASWLRDDGVQMSMGVPVQSIAHQDGASVVRAGSREIRADLVVMGTGVAPRGELAAAAGLATDAGRILVDASMRTSHPGILAAGDVARAENLTAGRRLTVEHWGDALGQGAVAGQVAAGSDTGWDAVPGFWSTIGDRRLKYVAWGDGFDDLALERHDGDAFTVRYGRAGRLVGVLTHGADGDYDSAAELIAQGAPWPR